MKTNYLLILFALLLAIPQAADAKKKKDIAIQLYSVRDIINNGTDLNVVLKNLAQMGSKPPIMIMASSMAKLRKSLKMLSKRPV